MKKLLSLLLVICLIALPVLGVCAEDWPASDVRVTVPWGAGGVTDQTVRAASYELERILGTRFVIDNVPGASGSVGTLAVLNGDRNDSILGAGLQAFVTYNVYGYTDYPFRDWSFYTLAFAPNAVVVPADSPFETLEQLVSYARENVGMLTIGTAGEGSGGHTGAEILSGSAGFLYRHVPYESGVNAVNATLYGDVDANCQLITETADYIRMGELRCLAVLSDTDIDLGGGVILPSILQFYPEMASCVPMGETIAFCLPAGTPEKVLLKLDETMPSVVSGKAFTTFCLSKGMRTEYHSREDAAAYVENLASTVCWTLYDSGSLSVSPTAFGIERR